MPKRNHQNGSKPSEAPEGITKITVGGYKSIAQEQSIEIRPLTILAGANSSGKSSIMQPLLLLKQTLEAPYDPGALLLNGPNSKFTSANQVLSDIGTDLATESFKIILSFGNESIGLFFDYKPETGFRMPVQSYFNENERSALQIFPDMTHEQLIALMPIGLRESFDTLLSTSDYKLYTSRERCFFKIKCRNSQGHEITIPYLLWTSDTAEKALKEVVHIPGLRGNPERTYPVSAVGPVYPGTFEYYAASVIFDWQLNDEIEKLLKLRDAMVLLGLTNAVSAKPINDAQVELRVGRTLGSDNQDTVSIADVGLGVSQTLPVLVALLAAKPGQLVYLEQPEIHLHPRAQTAMAQVLADAAIRGVRVVAETHSSLLLLGIQTLVAEGKLPPELVKLHWFTRGDDGATTIQSADLDEGGAFGDWPEDFGDVTLDAQDRFLDAAERHMMGV
jgi:predicted ATPase